MICEYLDEAYPDTPLLGRTLAERVEARRLVAWFDGKFAAEATRNLLGEKVMKRMAGRGNPDGAAMRIGYLGLRYHLEYLGWLAETRKWLAGSAISLADFTAAAHLSCLDFIGDVDWTISQPARDWYARMKSRPEFPGRAGGPRARDDCADALCRSGFLRLVGGTEGRSVEFHAAWAETADRAARRYHRQTSDVVPQGFTGHRCGVAWVAAIARK